MIELIFVIVILGILAAVAIPKLAATRDDAQNSLDCQNIATCITDMESEYTARQSATKSDSKACTEAETSTFNNISFTVHTEDMTVSGSPTGCSHLDGTYKFGGTSVSI